MPTSEWPSNWVFDPIEEMSVASCRFKSDQKGDFIESEEDSVESLWNKLPQTEGEERAQVLLELAQDAVNLNRGSQALTLAEEARNIYRQLGALVPGVEQARAAIGVGTALNCLHRSLEAAQLLDEAISLQRESNFQFLPDTLRTQGAWYMEANQYELALKSFLESVQILEIDGNEEYLAIDLYNAGKCFYRLKEYENSISVLNQALDIFRRRKELYEVSWVYCLLSEIHIATDNPEHALANARNCYAIAAMRKDNQFICRSALNKAKAWMLMGDFDQVAKELQEADYIASSHNDWELLLEIQNEYWILYLNLNKFEEAKEIGERIEAIREILG